MKDKNEAENNEKLIQDNISIVSWVDEDNSIIIDNPLDEKIIEHRRASIISERSKIIRDEIIGITLVLLCNFLRALNGLLMKYIQKSYSEYFQTIQFLFIRSFMIIILGVSSSYFVGQKITVPTEKTQRIIFLLRTSIPFFSLTFFTLSVWYLRVSTAQIITTLNPIIVTYLSVIFLKEQFYKRYIIGIILCVIGSLMIINNEKKDSNEVKVKGKENTNDNGESQKGGFTPGMILGVIYCLISTLIGCFIDLANKVLAKNKIHFIIQSTFIGIFMLFYSSLYVLFTWKLNLCFGYVILTFLQAILFFINNWFFYLGLRRIDLSEAAPISYTKVVFVLLFGGVILGEKVYFTDFIGAGLIISYMLYNLKYPLVKKNK